MTLSDEGDSESAQLFAIESGQFPRTRGTIPEAEDLVGISDGVRQVREIVARETAGAVSPRTQLLALYRITQTHHDAIARMISAARRESDGVLDAQDAIRLTNAYIEHMAIIQYWLQAARPFRRIPMDMPSPQELSPAKSRKLKESALVRVSSTRRLACEGIDQLEEIGRIAGLPGEWPALLEGWKVQAECLEILATISATGYPPLSRQRLSMFLDRLKDLTNSYAIGQISEGSLEFLWQSIEVVLEAIGNPGPMREALAFRHDVTEDPDRLSTIVANQILLADSDGERIRLIEELRTLASRNSAGPVFSRERLGRLSILRDVFWRPTVSTESTDARREVFEAAFRCYEQWLFGRTVATNDLIIRATNDWGGNGVVGWYEEGEFRRETFSLDFRLVDRLVGTTENLSQNQRPLQESLQFLDETVGPILRRAIPATGEVRIEAAGQIGLLPLLATRVDGVPIGASSRVAFQHPFPRGVAEKSGSPDLLVIDHCFGADASRVLTSARAAGMTKALEFDSDASDLDFEELVDALEQATRVAFYCHATTNLTAAGSVGLMLGRTHGLTIQRLAELDLAHIEELVLLACASGRSNPFLGQATLAHAAGIAGVNQVLFTLWPIRPRQAALFAEALFAAQMVGETTSSFVAKLYGSNFERAIHFGIMRS